VTQLLQRMRDELVRRNYAATTIRSYLHALNLCRGQHPDRGLDRLGPREFRRYQGLPVRGSETGCRHRGPSRRPLLPCAGSEAARPEGRVADAETAAAIADGPKP
jgi:hypothetical protein